MSEISAKQPDMLHLFTTYEVIMIIISRAYYQRYGSKTNFHRKNATGREPRPIGQIVSSRRFENSPKTVKVK